MDPVLIGAGVTVLMGAAGSAARMARRWAASEVARLVAEALDEQYRPLGPRPLLPRPGSRVDRLTGMEGFRRGRRADR
ncbi:hypothetical protein QR77_00640 [Streptomyces sp. 150FB]|nr:hypothetical protein QR77_00640 [Streptomyces sp. 150FB]